jgi:hypothetical protein
MTTARTSVAKLTIMVLKGVAVILFALYLIRELQ